MYTNEEMLGWRNATTKEKKVAQGLVLFHLKKHKTLSKMGMVMTVSVLLFCIISIPSLILGILDAIERKQADLLIIETIISLIVLIIIKGTIKSIYSTIHNRNSKKIETAIRAGKIWINDVKVKELISIHSAKGAVLDYWGKVEDESGNLYDKDVLFLARKEEISQDNALMIRIDCELQREYLIPVESNAKKTWELGLQLYDKYFK